MVGTVFFPLPFASSRQRLTRAPRPASASSAVMLVGWTAALWWGGFWARTTGTAGGGGRVGGGAPELGPAVAGGV